MNSRKAPFSSLAARLAFQVDKKILQLEEESYLRLDLSAHEAAVLHMPTFSKFGGFKRFAASALVIYLLLFSLTNAPAYFKIIQANIQQANSAQEAALQALQLSSLTLDPWTGKQYTSVEPSLPPEETLALLPVGAAEDQLLSLNLMLSTYDNRIRVPSLNINAPIVEPQLGLDALEAKDWNTLEDQIRSSLLSGVAHYPGTAEPGKIGNAFYTGHSSNVLWEPSAYNTVFALLPEITEGADIYLTQDQKEFHYRVISKKEVNPSDVSILKQGDQKILTLMTCTPVGTALKRLVVTAQLVED
ncbi:MAG: sortase [Candidatus Gracilibacteria bacterium]